LFYKRLLYHLFTLVLGKDMHRDWYSSGIFTIHWTWIDVVKSCVDVYMCGRSCSGERRFCVDLVGRKEWLQNNINEDYTLFITIPVSHDGDVCRSASGFSCINILYKQRVRLLFACRDEI